MGNWILRLHCWQLSDIKCSYLETEKLNMEMRWDMHDQFILPTHGRSYKIGIRNHRIFLIGTQVRDKESS